MPGADDYVPKPFQVAELRARIDSRLRAHRAEQALQDANRQASELAQQNYTLYEQARRDAEDRAALLRELDHRVRNNLSIIMGLVSLERTRGSGRPAAEALLSLENRLRAFLLAYEAFRRSNYRGVPLKDIIQRILQRLTQTFGRLTTSPPPCPATTTSSPNATASPWPSPSTRSPPRPPRPPSPTDGRPDRRQRHARAGPPRDRRCRRRRARSPGRPRQEEPGGEESVLRAIVETELGGRIVFDPAAQGTRVRILCPLESGDPRSVGAR
jgi:hypothetical protein